MVDVAYYKRKIKMMDRRIKVLLDKRDSFLIKLGEANKYNIGNSKRCHHEVEKHE